MRGSTDKYWWLAFGVVVVVAAVLLLASGGSGGGSETVRGGAPAEPNDDVRDAVRAHEDDGGGTLIAGDVRERLKALQAKDVPVVVVRWAADCGPCGSQLDDLAGIVDDLSDRVAVIGIGDDDAFLTAHPVPFPSLEDAEGAAAIGARTAPSTVVYDRTGKRTFSMDGAFTSRDELESAVRRYALGEIRVR